MSYVLGNDAALGGWGSCLVRDAQPIYVRHVALGHRTWRWAAMRSSLDELVADVTGLTTGEPVRCVVERTPMHYKSSGHGRSNEAVVGYGMGQLTGAILVEAQRRWGRDAYPWEVEAQVWRSWHRIGGLGSRVAYKTSAMMLCVSLGHIAWLRQIDPTFPYIPKIPDLKARAESPVADVAESILIAIGAAKNLSKAPKGPR